MPQKTVNFSSFQRKAKPFENFAPLLIGKMQVFYLNQHGNTLLQEHQTPHTLPEGDYAGIVCCEKSDYLSSFWRFMACTLMGSPNRLMNPAESFWS